MTENITFIHTMILKTLLVFLLRQNIQFYSEFYSELSKFISLNPRKVRTKEKKTVYNNVSELYNEYLEIYFNQYMTLSDAKKWTLGDKYNLESLFLKGYYYNVWSENKGQSTDKEKSVDLSDMPPLEGDKEVK